MYKLFDYVCETGALAQLGTVSAPPSSYESLGDVFRRIFEHELQITAAINKLVAAALAEPDFSTFQFLQWYVSRTARGGAPVQGHPRQGRSDRPGRQGHLLPRQGDPQAGWRRGLNTSSWRRKSKRPPIGRPFGASRLGSGHRRADVGEQELDRLADRAHLGTEGQLAATAEEQALGDIAFERMGELVVDAELAELRDLVAQTALDQAVPSSACICGNPLRAQPRPEACPRA